MKSLLILFQVLITYCVIAQTENVDHKLTFTKDFRFRIEQDWNSKLSNGTYKNPRSRLRYRVRLGLDYKKGWASLGIRLRTGAQNKQQDPQLTLGDGFKEFNTLPIGLETAYFQGKLAPFTFWLGKNTYPFEKNNELYWSDNVYPEGATFLKGYNPNSSIVDSINVKVGHYILGAQGGSFRNDSYHQGFQLYSSIMDQKIEIFPSIYLFKNIPNIPDVKELFFLDYTIIHIGTRINRLFSDHISLEFDYYHNIQDYTDYFSIPDNLKNQNTGLVLGLSIGKLKKSKDWMIKATATTLQRYAAVDFLAQNDWARWDYSSIGSPDGRLTNLKGLELVGGYMVNKELKLIMKAYFVEQLVPYGESKEANNRIRFDLDYKF